MKPRITIIGAAGQLGSELVASLTGHAELSTPAHAGLEVADRDSVEACLAETRPDVVINCAAFHRVDACEQDMARARAINKSGARHVAQACGKRGARCVFISTDYVFDGRKRAPYNETDRPCPLNAYGRTKYAGEITVSQHAARYLVVRVASLFGRTGARGKGGHFVATILQRARAGEPLKVIDDIRMSPTYAADAAALISGLVDREATGVVHGTNTGHCTWYEFAVEILRQAGLTTEIIPVPAATFPSVAPRPADSSLVSVRLAELGLPPPRPWQEALRAYLEETGDAQGG